MRVVKLGLISAVVFFLLLYLMSLLIPSHIRISRAVNINAPADALRPFVADTSKWQQWMQMDTRKMNVSILSAGPQDIATNWNYRGRSVKSSFRMEESAGITVLQWYFDFQLDWTPWEKFGSITFDKQFGTPMEASLNNLKKLMEKTP
jgi:hypothetical protein